MVDRRQVLAFRLSGHHLDRRLPADGAVTAFASAGMRNAHGSALLALNARVRDITPDVVDSLIASGDIVDVIGPRGADLLVPAADRAVFTIGTLPADDESLRARLRPFIRDLDTSGWTATEALRRATDVARAALASGPVGIGVLSGALTTALPELSPMCRGRCRVRHIEQEL